MYCEKCGKQINDTDAFCPFCGAAVRTAVQSPRVEPGYRRTENVKYIGPEYDMTGPVPHIEPTVKKTGGGGSGAGAVKAIVAAVIVVLLIAGAIVTMRMGLFSNNSNTSASKEQGAVSDTQKQTAYEKMTADKDVQEEAADKEVETATADLPDIERARSELARMNSDLEGYIWVILWGYAGTDLNNVGDSITIDLNDEQKVRASVLASDPDGEIDTIFIKGPDGLVIDENAETGPFGDGYAGKSVSGESVKKKCMDLFGTDADIERLQTIMACFAFDAVKYEDANGPRGIILSSETETETDMETIDCSISSNGDGFDGEADLYWGYWGEHDANPGKSNFRVKYTLVPDERSEHGLVITSMKIERISELDRAYSAAPEPADDTASGPQPFYGVWCSASKDADSMDKVVQDLTDKGFDGYLFVSSDWSGLNSESWYVVSAGICKTEDEAETVLESVKKSGYPDAYIKYSGDYIAR